MAETGLEKTGVVEVVVEKRLEDDSVSELSQLEKPLEVGTEEEFSRNKGQPIHTVKWPMWMTSLDYIIPSSRTAFIGDGDPTSFWEAMISAQEEVWVLTMKKEMVALVENDTWEIADCPKNVKVIDNCWVIRTKLNADSFTKGLHARLVSKGPV